VLGVVAPRQLAVHSHQLQRGQTQALALEAGEDLAGELARERVGLDQDQRPVHVGLSLRVRLWAARAPR
jgi:hypothetical protein